MHQFQPDIQMTGLHIPSPGARMLNSPDTRLTAFRRASQPAFTPVLLSGNDESSLREISLASPGSSIVLRSCSLRKQTAIVAEMRESSDFPGEGRKMTRGEEMSDRRRVAQLEWDSV